jgi:hypothetical protein
MADMVIWMIHFFHLFSQLKFFKQNLGENGIKRGKKRQALW